MTRLLGFAALIGYLLCIPLANWMIGNVGTTCVPNGPCLVPVWPGITAPSGVLAVGFAFVLQDIAQRHLGKRWIIAAIVAGSLLAAIVAPPTLVLASLLAYMASESVDAVAFGTLQRRNLILAVAVSGVAALTIDSFAFLWLAFGSLDHLAGQIIGKLWAIALSLPVIVAMRYVAPAPMTTCAAPL